MPTTTKEPAGPVEAPTRASDPVTMADPDAPRADASFPSDPSEAPQIPDHILIRPIGRGAYGQVWLARNVMGAHRAVKIVHRDSFEHARPFEREFNGIKKFEPISRSHDGLVDVLQVGRAERYFYYVMELADDAAAGQEIDPVAYVPKTLRSEVKEGGRLSFERCLEVALALTQGLGHMHRHGLIHRDIKPSNIILVHGIAKLADIGLVAEQSEAKSFVGTEGFIPPEGPGTPQGDIYSLGKVLYEIATGKDRHEFPALPTLLGEGGEETRLLELNTVFLRACQGDLGRRYQSCEQMREDLLLLQSGKSVAQAQKVAQRLALLTRVSVAAVLVALLVLAVSFHTQRQAKREMELRLRAEAGEQAARKNLYAADMLLAQQAIAGNNRGRAAELLERHRPGPASSLDAGSRANVDLRGWEWCHLWQLVRSDELFQLGPHSHYVTSVLFSPDGRTVWSASEDRTVKQWSLDSREALVTLPAEDGVRSIALSRDGKFLAFGGRARTVHLWDLSSNRLVRTFPRPASVLSLAFSMDDRILAVGGMLALQLWDVATGRELFHQPFDYVDITFGLDFSPDGRTFAYHRGKGVIALLSLESLEEIRHWSGHASYVLGLAFSPDGEKLASGGFDNTVRIWDTATGSEMASLTNHTSWIGPLRFSADGRKLATPSADQSIKLWDTTTWQELATLKGHLDEVWSVAFSPDGQRLVSGGKDETVRVWDAQSMTEPMPRRRSQADIEDAICAAGEREMFVISYTDGARGLIDMRTLEETGRSPWPPLGVGDRIIAVARSASHVAVASNDGSVRLWSTDAPQEPTLISPPGPTIRQWIGDFSEDGGALMVARENRAVELWNVSDKRMLALFEAGPRWLERVALSSDGAILALGYIDGSVEIWHVPQRRKITPARKHKGKVQKMIFAPGGKILATGGEDAKVKLWDTGDGREIATLGGQLNSVPSLAISPDGARLAVVGGGSGILLWDITTPQEPRQVGSFEVPAADWLNVAFSADGSALFVSASSHINTRPSELLVWRAPSLAEIEAQAETIHGLNALSPAGDPREK